MAKQASQAARLVPRTLGKTLAGLLLGSLILFVGCRPLYVPTEKPSRVPAPRRRIETKPVRIVAVEPTKLKAERGGTVTLRGEGFPEAVRALIEGVPASRVVRHSDKEISFLAPARSAGSATITLVVYPGTAQEERIRLEDVLDYLAPHERLHLHVTTRLIELPSGKILDARLLSFSEDFAPLDEQTRERLLERAGDVFGGQLPLGEFATETDRIRVVHVPTGGVSEPKSASFENGLVASLRGRGIRFAEPLTGADVESADFLSPRVFYVSPLPAESFASPGTRKGATKLLSYRVVAQVFEDVRERMMDATAASEEGTFEGSVKQTYERTAELARGLPESAASETTLLVRLPVESGVEVRWSASDYLVEDAVLAGVRERIAVFEKSGGLPAKPAWLHAALDSPSDPLAYTSWEAFRRANPGAASVFFYRPSGAGLYGRLADASTGNLLWSGRLASPDEILAGGGTQNPHDAAYDRVSGLDWTARIPADATIWVTWDSPSDEAYDGLLSALTDAGIRVREPMVTAYREMESPDGRIVLHDEPPAILYRERAQSGVTHVLHCDATAIAGTWQFRLVDANTGKELGTWSAVP